MTLPTGITLRKDGRYMWRFRYNGQQYTGYSRDLTDAKKALRDKRYEVEHGIYSKQGRTNFDAWFTEWMTVYKIPVCKDSSIETYQHAYDRHIKPAFGKRKLKDIRADQVQRFLNSLAKIYSKSILSTVNLLLYGSLRQAMKNGLIPLNPMDYTTLPKAQEREKKKALSADHEKLLLDKLKANSEYFPIFRTGSLSGMRIGEILGLTWGCVDFDREEIRVRHTMQYSKKRGKYLGTPKSKSSTRSIPMHKGSELFRILKQRHVTQLKEKLQAGQYWTPTEGLEDLVFTRTDGTPTDVTCIRNALRHSIEQLQKEGRDIPYCTFHTFRHCFATRCIEAGMDPKTLQAILGHSSFAMTMDLYCDVMEETKRREMKRISAIL